MKLKVNRNRNRNRNMFIIKIQQKYYSIMEKNALFIRKNLKKLLLLEIFNFSIMFSVHESSFIFILIIFYQLSFKLLIIKLNSMFTNKRFRSK